MYTYVKQAGLSIFLTREAPSFLVAFIIAEVFYKFRSFTLECAAFLITWYALSWAQARLFGPRA